MKSCTEYEGMIEAWLDDELGGEGLDELRAHAVGCEACGASLAEAVRLKGDLRSLTECADRIAKSKTVTPLKYRITATWKIAAAVLIAVGLFWSVKAWRGNSREGPVQVAEAPSIERREVIRVADAEDIVPADPSRQIAVQFETKRSDVKILWVYSAMPAHAEQGPTSSPSS